MTGKRLKLSLVLLTVSAVVGVALATPLLAWANTQLVQFGYKQVRSGTPDGVGSFQVTSPDLQDNQPMTFAQQGDICGGGNQAPRLNWSGAPARTKSFAMTMYDPDAPTGSGFWHCLVWDIPARTDSLNATSLPTGAVAGTDDIGRAGYLGPCPPPGDITHHYQFTVFALDEPSLGLSGDTRPAVVGFTMRLHILAVGRMKGTYSIPLTSG